MREEQILLEIGRKKNGEMYALDIAGAGNTLVFGTKAEEQIEDFLAEWIRRISSAGRSMIVTDPDGRLYEKTEKELKKNGYAVLRWNPEKPEESDRWNLFPSTGNAGDWASGLMEMFSQKRSDMDGYEAERCLLEVLCLYVRETQPENRQTMSRLYGMLMGMTPGKLEKNIEKVCTEHPDSEIAEAYWRYKALGQGTGNTMFSLGVRLGVFQNAGVRDLTDTEKAEEENGKKVIPLSELSEQRAAVFCPLVPDPTRNVPLTIYFLNRAMRETGGNDKRTDYILHGFQYLPVMKQLPMTLEMNRQKAVILLSTQSIRQIMRIYPGDGWKDIQGGANTALYFGRVDYDTARFAARRIILYGQDKGLQPRHENSLADSIRQQQGILVIEPDHSSRTVYTTEP